MVLAELAKAPNTNHRSHSRRLRWFADFHWETGISAATQPPATLTTTPLKRARNSAMKPKEPLKAILWHQGESGRQGDDSGAPAYKDKRLNNLSPGSEKDLASPDLPFIVVK